MHRLRLLMSLVNGSGASSRSNRSRRRLLGAVLALGCVQLLWLGLNTTPAFMSDEDAEIAAHPAKGKVQKISTVAGVGIAGFNRDGLVPKKTLLYWPQDVFIDKAGNLLILDWNNHRVRKAKGLTGKITTIIGSGFLGDGVTGPAAKVNLNHPTSVTQDSAGRIVMTGWHNWKIKRLNEDGNIQVLAGTSQGFSGDGNIGTKGQMDLPSSAEYDAAGNLYISDQGNRRIRKLDPSGMLTTFAGTGVAGFNGDFLAVDQTQFNSPRGSDAPPAFKLCIDGNKLYLADTLNHRVRVIDIVGGIVSTLAGTGTPGFSGDDGPATAAQLNFPTDVAVGPDHSVYICDSRNHAIRKVMPNGEIHTVAGTGVAGFNGDGKAAYKAKLDTPGGIFVDAKGVLFIADSLNNRIRMVK